MTENNNFLYENDSDIYNKYNSGKELFGDPYFQRYISYMKVFTNSFLDELDFNVLSYVGDPFEFSNDTYQCITYEHMKDKKLINGMNIDSGLVAFYFLNPFTKNTEIFNLNEDSDSLMKGSWNIYEARDKQNNIKCISILNPNFDYNDIDDLSVFKQEHDSSDILGISFNLEEPTILDFSSIAEYDDSGRYIDSGDECLIDENALHLINTQNEVATVILFYDMYSNIVGVSIFLEDEYFPY